MLVGRSSAMMPTDTPDTPRDNSPTLVPRLRFSLRWLVFAIAVLGCAFGFVAMSIREIQRQDRRMSEQAMCYSSLNNISLSMYEYSKGHGRFPRPFEVDEHGEKMHSWRAVISGLLPQDYPAPTESYDFHQRWDSQGNSRFSTRVPGFLQCPSRSLENPHGSPFVMINDFGDTPIDQIPANAVLVLEAWDANHDWLDPRDKVEDSPRIKVDSTDHPAGIGVILRDFSVIRARDTSRIKKDGKYYVLERTARQAGERPQ
jgi:hypothetical protein